MTTLHIPIFHGIAPKLAPRKLTQAQGQVARNCNLMSQELAPFSDAIEINTPTKVGTKQAIYKLGSLWLHWLEDVDVARSPLYLEQESRIHYTGHYNPKSTNETLAQASGTDYPTDYYRLGIPRPDTAPTIGETTPAGNSIELSYVYTFVSDWGEEGPPSPVGTATVTQGAASWDLTTIDATPQNSWTGAEITSITFVSTTVTVTLAAAEHHFFETTEYCVISSGFTGTGTLPTDIIGTWQVTRTGTNTFTFELPAVPTGTVTVFAGTISREAPLQLTNWTKRIYRTLAGTFRFVGETTTTTFTDTVSDANLGEQLPGGLDETKWWKAPHGDMIGITQFPGGILAGFYGNTLALSEPYVPSAWPTEYLRTFNYDIVSIGVVGNSIVVATKGFPSLVIGDDPGAMVQSELELFQSCTSKRGLTSLVNGVVYPSPDGLVYVPAAGMPSLITEPYFSKKEWSLLAPTTFIADVHDDRYYAFYTNGGVNQNETGNIVLDMKEPGATFTTIALGADVTALHSDLETDDLFMMSGQDIVHWDSGAGFLTYTWLSKIFTTARPLSFTAAKVKLTFGEGVSNADLLAVLAAATASLETSLADTELSSTFGTANNFDSGAFGGSAAANYAVADGPYTNMAAAFAEGITARLQLYSYYDDKTGNGCERHLVHTQEMSSSCTIRIGNVRKGFLADQWEIELNGSNVTFHEILLGTSMRELAKI